MDRVTSVSTSRARHAWTGPAGVAVVVSLTVMGGGWLAHTNSDRLTPTVGAASESMSETSGTTESASPTEAAGPVPARLAASTTSYPSMSFDEAITATLQGFPDGTFAQLDLASPSTDLNVENRFDMGATVNVPGDSGADIALATWEGCLADGALAEYLVGSADNLGTAVQGRVTARDSQTAPQKTPVDVAVTLEPVSCSAPKAAA